MTVGALQYDEIEVRVEPGPDGYVVRASTRGAEARAPFELAAMPRRQIEELVLQAIAPRRRRIEPGALGEITSLGSSLFDALIRADVRDLYRSAAARADAAGRGLRVRLLLTDADEFRGLPWELLFDEPSFMVLDKTTPVVRSFDLPLVHEVADVEPPLRILGVVSSPRDAVALNVAQERRNVEKGLQGLLSTGSVTLRWLEKASLPMLLEALRQGEYHVLHFIGHGDFDEATEDGVLLMEDDEGFTCRVSSRRIGQVLRDHDSLRLAIINACEGGRDAVDDPFSGIAGSMLQQGVPAVVAMQFEITDRAAILFSRDLYDALANGYPVDAAVAEARKAIWADGNDIEWATPVLFLRAEDGRLFNVHPKTSRLWSRFRPSRRHALGLVAVLALVLALITGFLLYARDDGGLGRWQRLPDLPVALEGASMAVFDGRLWLAGGVGAAEGRPKISRVDVYDPGTKAWRAGPELPVALDHASLVATPKQLFVLGGISATGSVDTVYRLDSPTGAWQRDVPLPAPRGAGAAAFDGGRIIFAGGVAADGRAADDVWALQNGRWRALGRLQRPREKLAVASDGYGTVWLMAGRDPNDQANAFPYVDVVKAQSVKPAGEVSPVQGPAGIWWPGAGACMVGGQSADGFSGRVDCLGRAPDAPELEPARAGLVAAAVGRTVFVAGGYYQGVHGTRDFQSLTLSEPDGG